MKLVCYNEVKRNLESFIGREFQFLYHSHIEHEYKPYPKNIAGIIFDLKCKSYSTYEYQDERIYIHYINADGEKEYCYIDSECEWAINCE